MRTFKTLTTAAVLLSFVAGSSAIAAQPLRASSALPRVTATTDGRYVSVARTGAHAKNANDGLGGLLLPLLAGIAGLGTLILALAKSNSPG